MSNANPRTDTDASSPETDPAEPSPEQELEQSIEERYQQLEQQYDELRDRLEDYNRSAQEFIREHPGLSVAAALGTGYIIGRLAASRWVR